MGLLFVFIYITTNNNKERLLTTPFLVKQYLKAKVVGVYLRFCGGLAARFWGFTSHILWGFSWAAHIQYVGV